MTQTKRVYLAGPIFGCTDEEIAAWRNLAMRELGPERCFDPFVENLDYRGKEHANAEAIVSKDKKAIQDSDVLLANCWQPSYGTIMEILHAYNYGLVVVVVLPSLEGISPWLVYHADHLCDSLEEAIQLLRREYL